MIVNDMFFRREKVKASTFQECIDRLKPLGFTAEPQGPDRVLVKRTGYAALLEGIPKTPKDVTDAGLLMGNEIGVLVNGGYQMFFETPSGKRLPALAEQLKALHDFQEDLREGLGLVSLYNESLGTVSSRHMYDRVEERDCHELKKPWEVKI